MTRSRAPPPQGPYLTLTIPEALSLPKPEAPEKQRYEHVVDLLEHRAKHQAHTVAVGFSELKEESRNEWFCRTITYGQIPSLARSVASQLNASFIEASKRVAPVDPALPSLKPTPVIAILCPSGYDFFVHAAAVWYSGFALLPIALGTTPDGVKNLCSKTGACAILAHPKQKDAAEQTLALWGNDEQAPALIDLADTSRPASTATSPLAPPSITRHSTLIIFHSSGSTGLPKPIYHIHDFWTFSLSTAPGVDSSAYTTTPLYHGGMSDFFRSLQAGSSLFFHPITGAGLSTQAILAGCEAAAAKASPQGVAYFLTVPFILEMLSKESSGLHFLASKQLVSTGGAPLPQAVGDLLVHTHSVPLVSRLGSSECGFLMSSWRDFATDKGWNWLWGQEKGPEGELLLDWQENEDNPGLFELVVTAGWPTKLIKNREDGGFSTEDLYVRREEDGKYQYATRVDDTLVLLNGKKFAAGLIEAKLRGYEGIDDAVVFGSNRAMVGAIVVPATKGSAKSDEARHAFVQSLRPYLDEQVNASLPLHARLAPELIFVADEELVASIPRSSKGTLQRGQAYRKLESLFDRVYGDYERGTLPGYPAREALEGKALRNKLMQLANGVLPTAVKSYDDDLHRAGLDSIGATRLKAGINQSIEVKGAQDGRLQGNIVYECPTVEALAQWIESGGGAIEEAADAHSEMLAIVEEYGDALPRYQAQVKADKSQAKPLVILTGATGALGSQLLCQLAARSTPVLCLVRASDDDEAEHRVRRALSSRKLECSNWSDIHCLAATLGDKETLGVTSPNRLDALLNDRPFTIIHAAWSVNFALSLRSFEADNVRSLAHLLGFALRRGAQGFLFCSSIASVMATSSDEGPATLRETLSSDPRTAGTLGYSQSKWVGEALVARASKEAGLPRTCIARIGQLCSDSRTGVWNKTEAWPLMTRAGLRKDEVGAMPVLEKQPLDWLPVDVCARALLELAGSAGQSEPPPLVAHVCLPCDAVAAPMWEDWLGWLEAAGGHFERAALAGWLTKVEAKGGQVRGRALLDIWRGLGGEGGPNIETTVARERSAALRGAKAMDAELARKTLEQWKHVGFI